MLLDAGANPNVRGRHGMTAMAQAARNGCAASVEMLLKRAPHQVEQVCEKGFTPLNWACGHHLEAARLLVDAAPHLVNVASYKGLTPLMQASKRGKHLLVRHLVQHYDVELDTCDGVYNWTALIYASLNGHLAVVKELVAAGANLEHADNKGGQTALIKSAGLGHASLAAELIEAGADIDKVDLQGRTPISWAAGYGHVDVVRVLLRHGADVSIRDSDGCSPLHYAVRYRRSAVVSMLIEHGAAAFETRETLRHWAQDEDVFSLLLALTKNSRKNKD